MMRKQIALVIPYFGSLPHWFPYFVRSISFSPIVHVFMFGDFSVNTALPENISVHPLSLAEFNRLASRKIGMEINIANGYKVCDLKPAFGRIFADYLKGFDYWAFGDLDIVLGNLQSIFDEKISANDITSFRKWWVSGSFCILKNNDIINSLYESSPNYASVFQSFDLLGFDELGGPFYSQVRNGIPVDRVESEIQSFTHLVTKATTEHRIRSHFEDLACESIEWGKTIRFQNGELRRLDNDAPIMYVHFVIMKKRFFKFPSGNKVPDAFDIRNTGIYRCPSLLQGVYLDEPRRVVVSAMSGASRVLRKRVAQMKSVSAYGASR